MIHWYSGWCEYYSLCGTQVRVPWVNIVIHRASIDIDSLISKNTLHLQPRQHAACIHHFVIAVIFIIINLDGSTVAANNTGEVVVITVFIAVGFVV